MSIIRDAKTSNGWKVHMEQFKTAAEVVETCKGREITDGRFHDMKIYSYDPDWHSVNGYDEALDLMETGYQPIVDELVDAVKANIKGEMKRFGFENSVHGFAPVVPLALKGVPNSMLNVKVKPIKAKVVDIYFDSTYSCGVENREILECGKKILSTVIELEKQGYRFNLYVVQSYAREKSCDMMVVKVKSAEQPVDLKRISFPMAHTAFFRVIGFDWYSKVPGGKYRASYGHGAAYDMTDDELMRFGKDLFGKNAVMFAGKNILYRDKKYIEEVVTNVNSKN